MHLNAMTTISSADGHSALSPPKKSKKVYRTEFVTAHRACKTAEEREQLALIMKVRWTEAELHEYARVYYFRNGKDYPIASSYRGAIADLGDYYKGSDPDAKARRLRHWWPIEFRKGGSKPMPPRREALLKRGRGNGTFVTPEEYAWPDHTEEYRSMIEQRCREYFKIPPDKPLHPNAWAASHRWYLREQAEPARIAAVAKAAAEEAARIAKEAVTLVLTPKAKRRSPNRAYREDSAAFDGYCYWGRRGNFVPVPFTRERQAQLSAGLIEPAPPLELIGKLKPHFSYHFKGHTQEFREKVAALARKDHGLRPNAFISPTRWRAACHKHFVLIERPKA